MPVGQKVLRAETQIFLNKLKALDFGPIAYKLMHPEAGNGWTKTQTAKGIARYMAFLLLIYLYPNKQLVPTQEIDTVWHHHILDTSKYVQDCQTLFGRFVHHFPYAGEQSEADGQNWQAAFLKTQILLAQHFDQPVKDSSISQETKDEKKKPARCDALENSGQGERKRPTINIQAEILTIFPTTWDEIG